jgi:hypothetical protein
MFKFFFYTNLYAALIAVACTSLTSDTFNLKVDNKLYLFIFTSVLFVYNLDRLIAFPDGDQVNSPDRFTFLKKYKIPVLILTILSFITGIYFFPSRNFNTMAVVALTGLVSVIYILLSYGKFSAILWIRAIAKPILLSIAWILVTVFLPVLNSGKNLDLNIMPYSLSFLLLYMTTALWFDFKDRRGDLNIKKSNMANLISEKNFLFTILFLVALNLIFTSIFVKSLPLILLSGYYLFHSLFYRELKILDSYNEKMYLFFIDLPLLIVPAATQAGKFPWKKMIIFFQ